MRLGMQVRCAAVPAWKVIEEAKPEFAGRVRKLFDAGRHKTIATLRADGSPRISGIECECADGYLRFGSMPGARKGADQDRRASHPRRLNAEATKLVDQPEREIFVALVRVEGRAVLASLGAFDAS